jgi:hypothetical protein
MKQTRKKHGAAFKAKVALAGVAYRVTLRGQGNPRGRHTGRNSGLRRGVGNPGPINLLCSLPAGRFREG